jgi:hypothetical protein
VPANFPGDQDRLDPSKIIKVHSGLDAAGFRAGHEYASGMIDEGSLLGTLAQSAAAVVAIVGGFLVSRLVQLSSEREGLRRQLVRAQDELKHVAALYDKAHEYRQANSRRDFYGWVINDLIKAGPATLDRGALLDRIPRGSSAEEIAPYLDDLIDEIAQVKATLEKYVRRGDVDTLHIEDLRERGLQVPQAQENIYSCVADWRIEQLPRPSSGFAMSRVPFGNQIFQAASSAELRRLDDSIRDEQDLRSRKTMLEAEVARVKREIGLIGRPAGVTSAIVILAIYSVLGIVAPVVVMGLGWDPLAAWLEWLLVGLFVLGLSAVLAYIFWYAKTLNDPVSSNSPEKN